MPTKQTRKSGSSSALWAPTRRQVLKTAGAMAGVAALGRIRPAAAQDKGEVTILTWETYHDDAWVAAYTEKTNVKVTVIRAGSVDEMYAQTRSGAIKPDVIYFDTGSIPRYVQAGLIVPTNIDRIVNAANITPALDWKTFNAKTGKLYGVPYSWGTQPLMYNADKLEKPTSWAVLWDKKHEGRVSTFDDAYVNMPMIALYVGAKDPYNLTDKEFEDVRNALRELRPQIRTIARGFDDMTNIFAAGDAEVAYCQNVAITFDLQSRGINCYHTYPTEGTPAWVDNAILTVHSGERQEVYDFINECITLPWQARFTQTHGGNGVITAANASANGVTDDVMKKTEMPFENDPTFWKSMAILDTPENFDRRLEIWNEFKAGTL